MTIQTVSESEIQVEDWMEVQRHTSSMFIWAGVGLFSGFLAGAMVGALWLGGVHTFEQTVVLSIIGVCATFLGGYAVAVRCWGAYIEANDAATDLYQSGQGLLRMMAKGK